MDLAKPKSGAHIKYFLFTPHNVNLKRNLANIEHFTKQNE